ncbi:THUMPD3 [Bugula neritina]|uniref:THUMPD3 n=1 Tax=Bugula neritina TaxID=10212 RepID=A0A7J7J9P6_BUGNE|nr:THUMPD3 [Bugula neritina]
MSCTLRASVVTGLEFLAADEVKERLSVPEVLEGRGFITWSQDIETVTQALNLKIIDHLQVTMSKFMVEFADENTAALDQLEDLVPQVDWQTGLNVWSHFTDFPHTVSSLPVDSKPELDRGDRDLQTSTVPLPKYRATCHRAGQHHKFSSPEAGHRLGGIIQTRFGWNVNLKDFDLEVVIRITDNEVTFGIALTKVSLYHRNVSEFSRTTLKANICAGLLRLADIQPNEIVVDPMCGSGNVIVEGALTHPHSFCLAGDIQEYCVGSSIANILAVNSKRQEQGLPQLNAGVIQWDATNLPLVTDSVDVIVTDLPYGKRMGNKVDNRKLYPMFLTEAARVTRPQSSRAVILTADRKCMNTVLPQVRKWWSMPRTTIINHGGIRSCIYLLRRTALVW